MKPPRALPSALLLTSLIAGPALALPWTVLVRSTAGEPLADAVVAVELRAQTSRAAPGAKAEMAQRERQFQPHVLVVQTGTAVNFPNFDTVRHHVYSFSPVKTFDIKLYSGTPAEPVLFDKPGIATLGCNIHDKMSAHIVVVDTPLFAKTDAQGLLKLDLPAGEHNLKVWHPRVGRPVLLGQRISVAAPGGQSQVSLSLE
ncbi:methylamine utilization protein [Paucibacter sp. XJ19-41]|uniref:methylamine utilization protein n=1 Tax=Paucibacter sp. XJ19-41 TaxID=2927824 RepID=UPI00234BAD24|nr:methylamine utilization protein [Paucibacter sp. XJ19-41]MDC6170578.1 methylamine utilization protein [Paucibacter sp. XJ19-41]